MELFTISKKNINKIFQTNQQLEINENFNDILNKVKSCPEIK